MESNCAKEIFRIVSGFHFDVKIDLETEILKSEKILHVNLHETQRLAVKEAVLNGFLVITGGPGTGKTTIINVLINLMERVLKKKILLMAPTGRAASRMKEATNYPASTIHKKLQICDDNMLEKQPFTISEDCVVCDETSMIDIYVARRVLQSIETGKQLIFIGDVEQLPSVGPGAVLKDIIDSGYIHTVCLSKVFRQLSDSNIYMNCRKIVKGNLSLEYGDDFMLLDANNPVEAAELMSIVFAHEVKEFGIKEVCCLTPYRKITPVGADAMNKRIQDIINPHSEDKPEVLYPPTNTIYRLGDKVMNLTNTFQACNGDIGFIVDIRGSSLVIDFEGNQLEYSFDDLCNITLGYCMTIHKSQGSEFKCVISTMLESYGNMLQMNLLNTACSRAKAKYICVGKEEALKIAISNRTGIERTTRLCEKIVAIFDYMGVA